MKYRPSKKGDESFYQYVKKRFNISQLARDTELTRPTVIAIVNGDTKKPGHEKLNAICKATGMRWNVDDDGLYFEEAYATWSSEPARAGIPAKYLPTELQKQLNVKEPENYYGSYAELFAKIAKLPIEKQKKLFELLKLHYELEK